MKKIGVITFSRSLNYGAFLQAYALQIVLERFETDASLIDYENPIDKKRYSIFPVKTLKSFISSFIFLPIMIRRRNSFRRLAKALKYTPVDTKYDIAIAGSDQIWNPELFGGHFDKIFFLEGIDARKKISYAPSIANEEIIDKRKNEYKRYIDKFDTISVREVSAREKLSEFIEKPIFVAADPVILLEKRDWLNIIKDKKESSKPYIFTYFVGGIRKNEVLPLAKVCEKLNMACVTYSKIPLEKNIYKYSFMDGPFDFLARLRDAKLVLTSSFHGVIFSIILQKNFYYFLPRSDRRSRVDSILNMLGLTDRIVESGVDLQKVNLKDIDYADVQKRLAKLRKESLDWLKKEVKG